jgi:hypothetical protein
MERLHHSSNCRHFLLQGTFSSFQVLSHFFLLKGY